MKSYKLIAIITTMILCIVAPALTLSTTAPEEKKAVLQLTTPSALVVPPVTHYNPFIPGFIGQINVFCADPLANYIVANKTWIPELATEWSYDSSTITLTVKLRKGVTWHDGKGFTSKDVLTTFLIGKIFKWAAWSYIQDIAAPDNNTVTFRVSKGTFLVLSQILGTFIYGQDALYGRFANYTTPEEMEAKRKQLLEFRPDTFIGTSIFKFKSVSETDITLEKYDKHWMASKCKFDQVIYRNAKTADIQTAMLLSGDVDFTWFNVQFATDVLKKTPGFSVIMAKVMPSASGAPFNCTKYPFNIKEVRQAIAYAINRTEFVAVTLPYEGIATLDVPLPASYVKEWVGEDFFNKLPRYPYNPAKTEEIFRSLGWQKGSDGIWVTDNGTRMEFTLPFASWAIGTIPDNLKFQFARVGIKFNLELRADYYSKITKEGGYGFYFDDWYYRVLHPYTAFNRIFVEYAQKPRYIFTETVQPPDWVAPGVGKVNLTEITIRLGETVDMDEQVKLVKILSWACAEYVPVIVTHEALFVPVVSTNRVRGWPAADNAIWSQWPTITQYLPKTLAEYGIIEPVPPPPPEIVEKTVEVVPLWSYAFIAVLAVAAAIGWALVVRRGPQK